MCPNRNKLLQVISLNQTRRESLVYGDMATFTSMLKNNLSVLAAFYKEHQLEHETKV